MVNEGLSLEDIRTNHKKLLEETKEVEKLETIDNNEVVEVEASELPKLMKDYTDGELIEQLTSRGFNVTFHSNKIKNLQLYNVGFKTFSLTGETFLFRCIRYTRVLFMQLPL
jgi:hypothetical protein